MYVHADADQPLTGRGRHPERRRGRDGAGGLRLDGGQQ